MEYNNKMHDSISRKDDIYIYLYIYLHPSHAYLLACLYMQYDNTTKSYQKFPRERSQETCERESYKKENKKTTKKKKLFFSRGKLKGIKDDTYIIIIIVIYLHDVHYIIINNSRRRERGDILF